MYSRILSAGGAVTTSNPRPGDICFIDWDGGSSMGHVEIVYAVSGTTVYTIGGNSGSGSTLYTRCVKKHDPLPSDNIVEIVRPNYENTASASVDVGTNFYAHIINTSTWSLVTNDRNNVSARSGTDAADQVWYFERLGDGSYKITSVLDGNCMEVHNFGTADGTNVQTFPYEGNAAQQWYISGTSGAYVFRAKCAYTVLDVDNNSAEDGTNVQMWTPNGTDAQLFTIWKREDYDTEVPPCPNITFSASQHEMLDGNFSMNDTITVSWMADNADSYWLKITNNQDGSYIVNEGTTSTSYTFHPPVEGSYTVAMRAYNEAGDSGRIEKTIYVRSVVGDTWVSDSLMGDEKTSFPEGTTIFFHYELFDPNTHDLLYTFSTMDTYVTLSIIAPSGAVIHTQTFNNDDTDYISCVCTEPGTYTAQVDLWGNVYQSQFTVETYVKQVASGWSGDTTWVLTDDGVLTFSGDGAMKNYTYKSEMPWYAYADQINSVVIEEGVTSIGAYAFYGMNITSIQIPASVTSIGDYAFKNAAKLDNVVLPGHLTSLGESAFYACSSLTSIEIPASLWTIKPYTFKNCTSLSSVTFHDGNLQKISDGAFYGTALTSVELPDCLAILDVYVFKNCSQLAQVKLSSSLTQIREASLYGTAISTIEIPEGVMSIKPYAFKNCVNLVSVSLPGTLTTVDEAAFYACTALKTVELPDAVTAIGNYAFRKCSGLISVKFGSGLVTIGESSFYGCSGITSLSIPRGVTTIKGYAFKGCTDLENVSLPTTLTTLGESAFHSCTGLSEIIIPAKVSSIGEYCFSGSTGIRIVEFLGNAPAIGTGAFNKITATAYYPGDNATWTAENMLNYGGTITWKAN